MTRTNDQNDDGRRLKSVNRTFDIIDYLLTNGPATLSQIAQAFDLPTSTAHLHLVSLAERDYVFVEDGQYQCSLRFLETGGELRSRYPVFRAAKPEVDELQEQLGEIANIGVEEDCYMVQLYKTANEESIDDNAPPAAHLHLHSTATGKVILAHLPEEKVDRVIERWGLPKETASTITDRESLQSSLDEIREKEYAINNGEHWEGVRAIAVPILSESDAIHGAISVSGPVSRIGRNRIDEEILPQLTDKRNIIELKLKQR